MSRLTLTQLKQMKASGEKIAVLTSYDASFSTILEEAGVDVILVGDSLGMVIQGQESTLPVTVDEMVYHTQNVVRGSGGVFVIADMPFMSYANADQALNNAALLMAKGGAQMVKLEGGSVITSTVKKLVDRGIPVCGHLGLLPQSVHQIGGYRIQGRDPEHAKSLVEEAELLEQAGAGMLVLECVPASLSKVITEAVDIPVIGIGAGAECDGQVLVLYDMLGITSGKRPRFSQDFLIEGKGIPAAISDYVKAVKSGEFPNKDQQY